MRIEIAEIPASAEHLHPGVESDDASGLGINYADAVLKATKTTLEDGRKVLCKRRGLEITVKIGDEQGKGLMRRLEHGPDVKEILRQALSEAAAGAGIKLEIEDGTIYLEG